MSVHRKDGRWVVRWRSEGRQRSRSFPTKREAVEFERLRQRDAWRDSVAMPEGAVPPALANDGASFLVSEDLWEEVPSGIEFRSQRPIHEGYFQTIGEADAYRRKMPDADALGITLLYDRYPWRDLTDDELASGELSESEKDKEFARFVADARQGGPTVRTVDP